MPRLQVQAFCTGLLLLLPVLQSAELLRCQDSSGSILQGMEVLFPPKFHCELNCMEQCWGYAKRVYRGNLMSSSKADLERNVIAALNSVPVISIWQ